MLTDYGKRTVSEMVLHFQHGHINLDPGFQRQSVWSDLDRRRLIQSIISEYPLPNIFLYRRASRGKTVYDVIDGKQRLETVLMFFLGLRGRAADAERIEPIGGFRGRLFHAEVRAVA